MISRTHLIIYWLLKLNLPYYFLVCVPIFLLSSKPIQPRLIISSPTLFLFLVLIVWYSALWIHVVPIKVILLLLFYYSIQFFSEFSLLSFIISTEFSALYWIRCASRFPRQFVAFSDSFLPPIEVVGLVDRNEESSAENDGV